MPKRIYVGNLPFQASTQEVEDLFAPFGRVNSVDLVTDRETGRPRGFGFVEMENGDEADEAIAALASSELAGRPLTINEARPKSPRPQQRRW